MQTGEAALAGQRIGVPAKVLRARNGLPPCRTWSKTHQAQVSRCCRVGCGRPRQLFRRFLPRCGSRVKRRCRSLGVGHRVSCATANAAGSGLSARRRHLDRICLACAEPQLMEQLAARKVTVLAIDCLPRTLSRAQKMDALTSMAGVSGYRAVIEAANAFGRFSTARSQLRQGSPSKSVRGRGWRGGSGCHRHCGGPWCNRSRQRYTGRSGRSSRLARWRVRQSGLRGRGLGRRWLR